MMQAPDISLAGEIKADCCYSAEYRPKEVEEQVSILRRVWPRLEPGKAMGAFESQPLIAGAEARFAVVRWIAIGPEYGAILEDEIFAALCDSREGRFSNYRLGELRSGRLRQTSRTADAMELIYAEQKSDILIIAGQFGAQHSGRSVKQAISTFAANEFGLDSAAIGSMLLTHPTRLKVAHELKIDAAGDEYDHQADESFGWVPCFGVDDNGLGFTALRADLAGPDFGSASGFLRPRLG